MSDFMKWDYDYPCLKNDGLKLEEIVILRELVLLSEIDNKGYCFPTNLSLAYITGSGERSVERYLEHLEKMGYIKRFTEQNGFKKERKIYPQTPFIKKKIKENSLYFLTKLYGDIYKVKDIFGEKDISKLKKEISNFEDTPTAKCDVSEPPTVADSNRQYWRSPTANSGLILDYTLDYKLDYNIDSEETDEDDEDEDLPFFNK